MQRSERTAAFTSRTGCGRSARLGRGRGSRTRRRTRRFTLRRGVASRDSGGILPAWKTENTPAAGRRSSSNSQTRCGLRSSRRSGGGLRRIVRLRLQISRSQPSSDGWHMSRKTPNRMRVFGERCALRSGLGRPTKNLPSARPRIGGRVLGCSSGASAENTARR